MVAKILSHFKSSGNSDILQIELTNEETFYSPIGEIKFICSSHFAFSSFIYIAFDNSTLIKIKHLIVLIIVSLFTTGSPIERDYNSEPEKVNTLENNNYDGKHVIKNNLCH